MVGLSRPEQHHCRRLAFAKVVMKVPREPQGWAHSSPSLLARSLESRPGSPSLPTSTGRATSLPIAQALG